MSDLEIKAALADVLEDITGLPFDELRDDMSVRGNLNLDSLDLIALATEIHARLGVALEIADVDELATVGGLIHALHEKLSTRPSSNTAA